MAGKFPWSKANHLQCCYTPAVPPWALNKPQQAVCQRVICFFSPIRTSKNYVQRDESQMHWDVDRNVVTAQGHPRKELQAHIQTHAGTCEKCKQSEHHDSVLTPLEVRLSLGAAFWKQSSCSLTLCCVVLTQQSPPYTPNTSAVRITLREHGNVIWNIHAALKSS